MLHGYDTDANSINSYISQKHKLRIIKCNAKDSFLRNNYKFPSPSKWLSLIKEAKYIVTNSFHGTVFCLIFHKPFIALLIDGEMNKMNSRIVDLLTAVNLNSRIKSADSILDDSIFEDIDWTEVDKKINNLRSSSFDFLTSQNI